MSVQLVFKLPSMAQVRPHPWAIKVMGSRSRISMLRPCLCTVCCYCYDVPVWRIDHHTTVRRRGSTTPRPCQPKTWLTVVWFSLVLLPPFLCKENQRLRIHLQQRSALE